MFPGQGSQYVGMTDFLEPLSNTHKKLFDLADEILNFSLSKLIHDGPDELLTKTSIAQPALLVTSLAAVLKLEEQGQRADIVMGHSLGEYTALVHAGSLEFKDALRLVRERGLLMENASQKNPGKMIAVIGSHKENWKPWADRFEVDIANINAPTQIVLSGTINAINKISLAIEENQLGQIVPLNVSAPFHSSLMKPLAREFETHLEKIEFKPPKILFIDNVTGNPEQDPQRIKQKLVEQVYKPVQWQKAVESAWKLGGRNFVECGPGKILAGLVKKITRELSQTKSFP